MADEIETSLHQIDTRLALVEAEMSSMVQGKRWIQGIAVVLIIQIILAAMAFARLSQQVDTLDLERMNIDISTALSVLGSHGNELEAVRAEQFRQRESMDLVRIELSARTRDRFTSKDAEELKARITRLESSHFNGIGN